jgi:uracil-DNA glycosylase
MPSSDMPSRKRGRRCVVRRLHVEETMAEGAEGFIPRTSSLARLASAANRCRGCDLYRFASRAVFGEGPRTSAIVLVGEQPGDQEDRTGRPFVGPAGGLLDRALVEAGMERTRVYVTNAVKHFKFVPRGKKRIHQKPGASEIEACRPWLYRELEVIRPGLLVCLGASAARAVLGPRFRLLERRGRVLATPAPLGSVAPRALATIHPSAALRAPEAAERRRLFRLLVADLKVADRAASAPANVA